MSLDFIPSSLAIHSLSQASILTVETAGEWSAVGLMHADQMWFLEKKGLRQQAEYLLPMVDTLLQAAGVRLSELNAVAFDKGPGSFTGLRIAASFVQAIASVYQLSVLPITHFAAMAYHVAHTSDIPRMVVYQKARRNLVYLGKYQYEAKRFSTLVEVMLVEEKVLIPLEKMGEHVVMLDQHTSSLRYLMAFADHEYVRGAYTPPEQAIPLYL